MNLKGKETGLMILIAVLWVVITLCGWNGQWFIALISGVVLMMLHMMIGSAQGGKVDKKLLLFPIVSWLIVWTVGFVLTDYYAQMFLGQEPTFSILGFHPSFAFIIFFYWIGGVLTLNIGFIKYADRWLSKERWDAFVQKVDALKKEEVL